jgi:hypothetical protein
MSWYTKMRNKFIQKLYYLDVRFILLYFLKCAGVNGCIYSCKEPLVKKQCPDNSGLISICSISADSCLDDTQCSQGQMCCSSGCGKKCLNI